MEMLHRWSLEWTRPHSHLLTTLILTDILCYQLPLVLNIIQTLFLPDSFSWSQPLCESCVFNATDHIPCEENDVNIVCKRNANKCNISAKKVNLLSSTAKYFSVCATDA